MLKKENSRGFDGSSNNWARVCDSCHSVTCTIYCQADSTYLCSGCDARMHAASLVASHHKRVWICEACKRAPAAFLCKADVASLCASCDTDIHSANLLAHRHHRVPIIPIPGSHHSFHREHIYSFCFLYQVSVSSMDVGVVPESAPTETPNSHLRPPKGTIDLFSGPAIQIPPQLTPLAREARVLLVRNVTSIMDLPSTNSDTGCLWVLSDCI